VQGKLRQHAKYTAKRLWQLWNYRLGLRGVRGGGYVYREEGRVSLPVRNVLGGSKRKTNQGEARTCYRRGRAGTSGAKKNRGERRVGSSGSTASPCKRGLKGSSNEGKERILERTGQKNGGKRPSERKTEKRHVSRPFPP